MKFAFIDAEKAHHPNTKLCRLLEVSCRFYAWFERPPSRRTVEDARLAILIREAHERSRRTYGSPRVNAEFQARGILVSRGRIILLMQADNIAARQRRRYRATTAAGNDQPVRRTCSTGRASPPPAAVERLTSAVTRELLRPRS